MPKQSQAEDTTSTTSTLVPSQEVRTTLTGQPIRYEHDNLSNMCSGESFQVGGVGANTLPPGYTDSSLVHIPIKIADYLPPTFTQTLGNDVKREQPRKESVLSRLSSKVAGSGSGKDADDLKIVAMSRGDYLKYWVKGEDGKFRDSVVEPPEGRAEWLSAALERQEREGLGKVKPQKFRYEGRATVFGAAGALISGVVN